MNELKTVNNLEDEYISKFLIYADVSEKSAEVYTRQLKQYFKYLSDNAVEQPTRETIVNYKNYLLQEHKPTTTQNYLTAVKLFYKWAAQMGLYANICDGVKSCKVSREHKKDCLTTSQIQDILEVGTTAAADDEQALRNQAIFLLMVTCGFRTIEVSRANIEDIRSVGNNTVLYIQGKGRTGKDEYITLPPQTEHIIRRYLAKRGATDHTEPLFISTSNHKNSGGRMTTRSISGLIKKKLSDAGYNSDRLTAHSLRHTAVTLALLSGQPIDAVQQFARHANINTTMIYNHSIDIANNQCSNAIAQSLFSTSQKGS